MSDNALPESEAEDPRTEFRKYCVGAVLAVLLTLLAFGLAYWQVFALWPRLIVITVLAAGQVGVHFHYFLHINLAESHRDEMQLILFTGLILLLMAGGTVWILWNLHLRM